MNNSNTRSLRVLTQNIAGLPEPISEDPLVRIPKLMDLIVAQKDQFDVICLQEVFSENVREIVINKLLPDFPYQIDRSTYNMPGVTNYVNWLENSGLFLASKIPIKHRQFIPFHEAGGSDAYAWKGLLAAKLATPGGKEFMVFTTHLQSDADGRFADVRKAQLKRISEYIQVQEFDYGVFCGDLNINENSNIEYHDLVGELSQVQGHDIYRTIYPDASDLPGYTMDSSQNQMVENYQARLDYIFALKVPPNKFRSVKLWYPGETPDKLLSDHFGVLAELEMQQDTHVTTHNVVDPFGIWAIKRVLFPCIP